MLSFGENFSSFSLRNVHDDRCQYYPTSVNPSANLAADLTGSVIKHHNLCNKFGCYIIMVYLKNLKRVWMELFQIAMPCALFACGKLMTLKVNCHFSLKMVFA